MSHKKTIEDLRSVLFEALSEAKDNSKPLDVARMRAISDIAQRITDTARVEVDFMRASGANSGTGFITVEKDADGGREASNHIESATKTGVQSIASIPGGRVITHKLR